MRIRVYRFVLNIQHARSNSIQQIHSEMNEAPNYTLLFQYGLYRRQFWELWDTLTISYRFLTLTLSPTSPSPAKPKQNSVITVPLESTIKKVVLKGQGLSLDPFLILKTQKRLLEYYRLQKEKEIQKRFFSTWFEVNPIQVRFL